MIPKKLLWLLGYNNLSIILEQERRHWLMKTDSNKQIQDSLTGDIFQGQIDNIGSDIIIESQKLPYKYDFKNDITFELVNADKILTITNSAFPHSAAVNGLMFARIISTNFPYNTNGSLTYNHYKIRFDDAELCILPFGASPSSSEVYADKWLKTTTPPTIMIIDKNTGKYTITRSLSFSESVTNTTYYYPMTKTLQPFDVTDLGYGSYELSAINDDGFIGYPLFWFTCDKSNIGPTLTFGEGNTNSRNEQIFFVSNEGSSSYYNAKIYTGIDGTYNATPDGSDTSSYKITCSCRSGETFTGTAIDLSKSIDVKSIKLVNKTEQTEYHIEFICTDNDVVTMSESVPWVYNEAQGIYEIEMNYFDQNCLNGNDSNSPLVSIFDIHFDENVPFVKSSTDVGIAGVRMGSANLASDVYDRYPYNLNKWEGLPEWMNELDDGIVPEHLVMYAFHQPPSYDPDNPESMQGAGLILDPGKHRTEEPELDENGEPIIDPDGIGRVYVLSNDDIEYKNNANEQYPKPARTAARICDIPTSVIQLTGVSGLSTTPIIDNKYTRTEVSYSEEDEDRLRNKINSRWVRPTALTANGKPVWSELGFPNRFAFPTAYTLNQVDMINHNDFRIWENLNPEVDIFKISIRQIHDTGEGYEVNDRGECIVGGYAFTYEVRAVNSEGGVTDVVLSPDDRPYRQTINIANFDLVDGGNTTEAYGTSRISGEGHGLKFSLVIDYDYFQSILPRQGDNYNDLFAFVRESDGLYVYEYIIDSKSNSVPKAGKWTSTMKISEFEVTSTDKSRGGIATQEAFINATIPSVRDLPVVMKDDNVDPEVLVTLQTSSFINVIDKTKTPVVPSMTSNDIDKDNVVDICKFYCDGFLEFEATEKNFNGVKTALKEANMLRFDSYVLWRWIDASDNKNLRFTAGVVTRGFNNLFTTDTITMLPTNKLNCDNFVHTNGNTTIVWDVPGIGVMMWIYDPTSDKKENYYVDPETMDLHITRETMTFDKIDIRMGSGPVPKIVDDDGKYTFNVMTNNPVQAIDESVFPIYQQPDMMDLNTVQVGKVASDKNVLLGNWKLVFPRVSSYTLKNDATNTQWIPKKMQVIKGRSIQDVGAVYDSEGNDVSMKSLIVDEGNDRIHLKMFNSNKKTWEEI